MPVVKTVRRVLPIVRPALGETPALPADHLISYFMVTAILVVLPALWRKKHFVLSAKATA